MWNKLDRNLSIADAYGKDTSLTCNKTTLNMITLNEEQTVINGYYKGIHKIYIDNNLEDKKIIIERGDKQETWEIMI